MTTRILIVEDENDLAAIVADYARAAGYAPEVIDNGTLALEVVRSRACDLIVLDLMLPGMDGVSLCREVRAFSDVPIIMVTARVEEVDRLLGLETGADDYVCKPFSPRELMARIKVILRRRRQPDVATPSIAIDDASRTIRIHAHKLDLTPSEYNLFAAMAKRPGTIYSRAQLLDVARADSLEVTDRAIDTHIKNLRRKIAVAMPDADIIQSVYGVGYRVEL